MHRSATVHAGNHLIRLFPLTFLIILVVWLCRPDNAWADVYAGQLEITNPDGSDFDGNFDDGTGALLSFFLNDDASSVEIAILEAAAGTIVHEIDAGAMERGFNSVEWDGTGTEAGASYVFDVTAEQPNASTEEWTVFFDSGPNDIWTRGGEVVRRMDSPRFGMMITTNSGGPIGKGIALYNADGSPSDPFLVASEEDWGEGGSDSMFSGILDEHDRYYVSVVQEGEVRRVDPDDFSVTTIITGLIHTKMLYLVGEGAERVLYITDDNRVVRAAIGDEDVFTGDIEVVAEFDDRFPRAVAVDDDGSLYVSYRETNEFPSDPLGLEKFDISGDLPVTDGNAVWSIGEDLTHQISELLIDRGPDSTTADDDVLYYATRAGAGTDADGVWRVDDIHASFAADVVQLISDVDLYESQESNIQTRSAISLDPAGNIVLLENANEQTFFLSPPGEGETNSMTTTSLAFTVGDAVSRESEELPSGYVLEQNYPNPFNPVTTISYTLGRDDFTSVKVYNALGAEVRTLVDEQQASGSYEVNWDGRDNTGRSLSSGVYLLRLSSGKFNQSIRMTLVK